LIDESEGPLHPGCTQTLWRDDARFVMTYWSNIAEGARQFVPSQVPLLDSGLT
jgi:hypothetical protein